MTDQRDEKIEILSQKLTAAEKDIVYLDRENKRLAAKLAMLMVSSPKKSGSSK